MSAMTEYEAKRSAGHSSLPNRHIYYEPPEDLDWDQETALVPPDIRTGTSEVIVHRRDTRSPVPNSSKSEFECKLSKENLTAISKPNGNPRAYTEEEFTSAILARTQHGNTIATDGKVPPSLLPHQLSPNTSVCCCPSQEGTCDHHAFDHDFPDSCPCTGGRIIRSQSCSQPEENNTFNCTKKSSVDDVLPSCENALHPMNATDDLQGEGSVSAPTENIPEAMVGPHCDCEREFNQRHSGECKVETRRTDYASSPILERRNKGVLGRLRNFASRTSYSTSEDGHSHSSDYEEQEEDKRLEIRFARDSSARSSSSWAGRVRDLHRDVKRKISRLRNSKGNHCENETREGGEIHEGAIQPASSAESIPSGSGSSLQPPTPTSSNRSSTSAGEEDNSPYVGTFLGRARALVDYTPSPYDRDGLAFKKGDLIDIIAKHKTGIWVGMVQGKVGQFKFINVEEILSESKPRQRRRIAPPDWFHLEKKPETLEELLLQLGLQEYMNVLVLNGYDELETLKEIEKEDLDNLGIVNPDHGQKLLRAAELFCGIDLEGEDDDDPSLKQSPRDSGCYASHENLIHRETSQRLLHNGLCMVDGEDQDTSHSESGIHLREGQDISSVMNNLDVSVDSSTKSTSTTVDSTRDDTGITTDTMDCLDDKEICKYNIPPLRDPLENEACSDIAISTVHSELPINSDCISVESIQTRTVNIVLCNDHVSSEMKVLSSEHNLGTSQMSDSNESCKKHRNKHAKDNAFVPNYQQDSKRKDNCHSSHSLTWYRYQPDVPNDYVEYSPYVHSWTSFSKKDKSIRRKVKEYDDVVSDPATEPEESPGKHVYRRSKQRKGSLQALIPCPSPPSPTVVGMAKKKLDCEGINLCDEPYTDKTGFCGIPPALVQRYAEELQHGVGDMACALDQIRITSLQQQARRGVPNDFLADSCIVPVIEANYSNLHNWLIFLGLPMYEEYFSSSGYTHLNQIISFDVSYLSTIGINNPYHQVYLKAAINALQTRLGQRPSMSPPPLPQPSSSSFVL